MRDALPTTNVREERRKTDLIMVGTGWTGQIIKKDGALMSFANDG